MDARFVHQLVLSTTSTSLKGKCPFLPFSSPSHIPFSFCFVTLIVSPAWRVKEDSRRVSGGQRTEGREGGGGQREGEREEVKDRGREKGWRRIEGGGVDEEDSRRVSGGGQREDGGGGQGEGG